MELLPQEMMMKSISNFEAIFEEMDQERPVTFDK